MSGQLWLSTTQEWLSSFIVRTTALQWRRRPLQVPHLYHEPTGLARFEPCSCEVTAGSKLATENSHTNRRLACRITESNVHTYSSRSPKAFNISFMLRKSLCWILDMINHWRTQSVPTEIKANCMCLRTAIEQLRAKLLNKFVVPSPAANTSRRLPSKRHWKRMLPRKEFVIEACKRIDVYLALDIKPMIKETRELNPSKNWRQPISKLGAFHNHLQFLLNLIGRIYSRIWVTLYLFNLGLC